MRGGPAAAADSTPAPAERRLTVAAGSLVLINFDSWHRFTTNRSTKPRIMLKFHFLRLNEPRPG
jgi:ectoine hydroxylase-related dioxygenase (phytanoyl-CoA dioxygenase family)